MGIKICSKCKKEKELSEFQKLNRSKDGLQRVCRDCRSIKSLFKKAKEKQDYELFEIGLKQCGVCEQIKKLKFFKQDKESHNGLRSKCRECIKPEIIKYGRSDSYRKYQNKYQRLWREKNRSMVNERARINAQKPKYKKKAKQRNSNISNKITSTLRHRVNRVMKDARVTKAYKTMEMLGCTIDFFRKHIESLFTEGMVFDNYGNKKECWNLDHIIPCASFDLAKKEEQLRCFHYTNYQPLWRKPNLLKSSLYNGVRHRYKKD